MWEKDCKICGTQISQTVFDKQKKEIEMDAKDWIRDFFR